jgi:hypothetical protein
VTLRIGVLLGLALAAAVAVWWLAATRIALAAGTDASVLAAQALLVLSLARPMLVSVLGLRSASFGGVAEGIRASVPVVAVAWPVVALAWLASAESLARTLLVEAALIACAVAVPLAGSLLARLTGRRAWTGALATCIGVALACVAWMLRDLVWRSAGAG